jgi:hypothetical protein
VFSALLPEALMQVGGLNLAGIGTLRSYDVVSRSEQGSDSVFVVRLHADETVDIRLTWRDMGGTWKVAGAARVQDESSPNTGVFQQLAGGAPMDLSWMDPGTEWGVRPKIGKHGLTLDAINVGSYGEIPAVSAHATQRPRGAAANADTPGMGISIFDKAEVWSPIAAALYEEAIQRRWSPATGIKWGELADLDPELEAAVCQVCTSISERQLVSNDVPAGWENRISYDFHEVKLFLATQIYDAARHVEAFRKRALANGGGLGEQSPGNVARLVVDSQGFAEMSLYLHVLVAGETALWLRIGAAYAPSAVEEAMFRLSLQDVSRHLTYGLTHLRYLLDHHPERAPEMHRYLDKGEGMLVTDVERDQALRDAITTLVARRTGSREDAMQRVRAFRARFVAEYLQRLDYAGLHGRSTRLEPRLAALARPA